MARRLCKLRRHDISCELTTIHKLVTEPKYLCRSCARASADKSSLCKPSALSLFAPAGGNVKPAAKATAVRSGLSKSAEAGKEAQVPQATWLTVAGSDLGGLNISKKQLKQAKKALKGQKKQLKKLSKVLKKQKKVEKQARKLQKQLAKLDLATLPSSHTSASRLSVH